MTLPRHLRTLGLAALGLWAHAFVQAQPSVSLQGSLGSKAALLMIDGEPRTLSIGQSAKGVRLVSLDEGRAMVEIDGRLTPLVMGASQVRLGDGAAAPNAGRQIVLSSGPGGHFTSLGTINGKTTQFLVDTGATSVSISQAEADQMGLKYRDGRRILTQTANGVAPAHVVTLNTVRIGDVEVRNVEAIVTPGQMSHVLLGNSFLTRFQMKRENEVLTLELRY